MAPSANGVASRIPEWLVFVRAGDPGSKGRGKTDVALAFVQCDKEIVKAGLDCLNTQFKSHPSRPRFRCDDWTELSAREQASARRSLGEVANNAGPTELWSSWRMACSEVWGDFVRFSASPEDSPSRASANQPRTGAPEPGPADRTDPLRNLDEVEDKASDVPLFPRVEIHGPPGPTAEETAELIRTTTMVVHLAELNDEEDREIQNLLLDAIVTFEDVSFRVVSNMPEEWAAHPILRGFDQGVIRARNIILGIATKAGFRIYPSSTPYGLTYARLTLSGQVGLPRVEIGPEDLRGLRRALTLLERFEAEVVALAPKQLLEEGGQGHERSGTPPPVVRQPGPDPNPDATNLGIPARALAAAYELRRRGERVTVAAAARLAGVDRSGLYDHPEVIQSIKAIATPDGRLPKGWRDRDTGDTEAIDEDLD